MAKLSVDLGVIKNDSDVKIKVLSYLSIFSPTTSISLNVFNSLRGMVVDVFTKLKYKVNCVGVWLQSLLLVVLSCNLVIADEEITISKDDFYSFAAVGGMGVCLFAYLMNYGVSHFVTLKEVLFGSYDHQQDHCGNLMKKHRGSMFVDMPNFFTVYSKKGSKDQQSEQGSGYYFYPASLELMSLPPDVDQALWHQSRTHYKLLYGMEKEKFLRKKVSRKTKFKQSKNYSSFIVDWRINKQGFYAFCLFFYTDASYFYQCVKAIYQSMKYPNYWNSVVVQRNNESGSWRSYKSNFKGVVPVFYVDTRRRLTLDHWEFVESVMNPLCGSKLEYVSSD